LFGNAGLGCAFVKLGFVYDIPKENGVKGKRCQVWHFTLAL